MNYFGTDGIRGPYGGPVVNQDFAYSLGRALSKYVEDSPQQDKKVLVGRDTRPSGKSLVSALSSGLEDGGSRPFEAGILPTPALAFGVMNGPFDLGVMITASHNPSPDNGFKIFSGKGEKLSIEQEKFIESKLDRTLVFNEHGRSCVEAWDGLRGYFDRLTKFFPDHFLDGLKIVADLANGATSETTVKVFSHFGAEVFAMNQGDGIINDGVGSEHPELMQERVRERKADFGLAHDGDGDRVIFADAEGNCVHGDQVLGLLALDSKWEKSLKGNGLVATEHSNSGLGASLAEEGIDFFRSEVGDRNVSLLMKEKGCNLGGESSGHARFKRLPAYWRRIVHRSAGGSGNRAKPKVTPGTCPNHYSLAKQSRFFQGQGKGSGFRKTRVGKSFGRGQSSARKQGAYSRQIFGHGAKNQAVGGRRRPRIGYGSFFSALNFH